MSVVSITTAKNAKKGAEACFPKTEAYFPVFEKITSAIKAVWPKKTTAHVSYLTGVSERAVRFWLAGETRMTVEHVTALLKTEEGFAILKAIMGDAKPVWWIDAVTASELRNSRKAIRAEQRRTERLKELRSQREMFEDQ
jgi:hypothetical protein